MKEELSESIFSENYLIGGRPVLFLVKTEVEVGPWIRVMIASTLLNWGRHSENRRNGKRETR